MTTLTTAAADPDAFPARAYLPRLVLGPAARDMAEGFVPVDGTLVIADITGFTPLSERLATLGKEGAELLTSIINLYFQKLLDSAVSFGGDNLKFGGDALLILFRGPEHADRAVAAALAMQSENRRAGALRIAGQPTHLQMRISLHSGTFWSAIAGEPGIRLQHIVAGPAISKLAEVDKKALPGEVAMSETTHAALVGEVATIVRDGTIVATGIDRRRVRELQPPEDGDNAPDAEAALASWGVTRGGEGEHRKVTVMFARLDGLNELLESGEAARAFAGLTTFVNQLAETVRQFGGYLASNDVDQSGIKFIVLFGAPIANEDAAANALRLAMAMRVAAQQLDPGITLRIGLNSGFTFCGDTGATQRREYTVLGDAVNLSARLMSRAEAGQVLVSDVTAAEAGPTFRWQPLAPMQIKGKAEPVPVRLLEGERQQEAATSQLSSFVGRAAERSLAAAAIARAKDGSGQVLVVSGEPGSGKSRLMAEVIGPLAGEWRLVRGEARSFTTGMPFAAWTGVLSSLLGLADGQDAAARTAAAAAALRKLDPALEDSAALLNPLLSLALPESDALRSLDADSRRDRLMRLFGQLLRAASAQRPTAVIVEDLHWADNSTKEVLRSLAEQLEGSRLLLCITSREAVELPGPVTAISLTELRMEDARALLESVLGSSDLPEATVAGIAEKCRGNPLFLEEVARALTIEGPTALGSSQLVPDRLQSLLMARLDALPQAARRVARLAAVLGTSFDPEIVRAMSVPDARASLELSLQDLMASGIVVSDEDGSGRYRFRHSLQQEVAYDSLLFARRRELHGSVTTIIETQAAADLDTVVETLAYHAGRSGDPRKTAQYSTLAGDRSRGVYAWESAIAYYNTALQALGRLPGGTSMTRSAVLERIGDCLELAGRYRQAAETYGRALDAWTLHQQRIEAGQKPVAETPLQLTFDEPARGTQLRLKTAVAFERNSQYDRSLRWLRAARGVMPPRRPDLRADIFSSWSVVAFRKGQFVEAVEWARKALAAARITGQPARIAYSHHVLANCYGETGRLRRSVYHREAALVIYEQLGDLPRLFAGHGNLGLSYQGLGDFALAVRHHLECIKAAEQIGNEVAAAIGQNNLGEVLLAQGHVNEAADCFEKTIAVYRQRGEPRVPAGLALVNLSRARLKQGFVGPAKDHLVEGMQLLGAVSRGLATEGILQEAEIELAQGELHAAAATSARAVDEANALGMLLLEARARLLESRIEAELGNQRQAVARAQRSLTISRRLGAAYEMAHAYLALAELAAPGPGEPPNDRAVKLARSAAELFERIGSSEELDRALQLASAN